MRDASHVNAGSRAVHMLGNAMAGACSVHHHTDSILTQYGRMIRIRIGLLFSPLMHVWMSL